MAITVLLCLCVLCTCLGALVAVVATSPRKWRRIRPTPTLDQAIDEALKEQVDQERHLNRAGIHYWSQQRERAVLQRIERKTGKVATPTMAAYVHQRILQVETFPARPKK